MSLTQDQIIRLQKLTALRGSENININGVVDFFTILGNVKNIPHGSASRSGQSELNLREDIVKDDESLPDALLACSKQKRAAHQIVLSGIMHGE